MATKQQLINYVKDCLKKGMPEWQIKKKLLSTGWTNEQINDALKSVMQKIPSMNRAEELNAATLNQQLIKYVKASLQRDAPLEQIRKNLISSGWSDNEIKWAVDLVQREMHSYPEIEPKRTFSEIVSGPTFKFFLIPALIILALLIIIILLYSIFSGNSAETLNLGPETAGLYDCKNNFQCFIDSSKNCEKTKVRQIYKTNIQDIEKTINNYYELRGVESDKCLFYLRVESIDIKYGKELIKSMTDSGISKEGIEQREKVENIQANAKEGSEGTCEIKISDLAPVLETWKLDNSNTGIFPNEVLSYAICSGSYFN